MKKEYTSPFSHILQSAPTTLPPSFDTPQGARGEGFVLGDRDKVPTSLFNSNSTLARMRRIFASNKCWLRRLFPARRRRRTRTTTTNSANASRDEKEDHLTANDLYKTELCRSWTETGECRYNDKCQFAHGRDELRCVVRHPKYKTQVCRTFMSTGQCPYGSRCRFIRETSREGRLGHAHDARALCDYGRLETGGGKDPLCLRKNISGESGDIDVTWDDKEDDTPKRLGIFRHITHDESLSLSEGQPSSPSSPTSAEGEIEVLSTISSNSNNMNNNNKKKKKKKNAQISI